VIEREVPGIAEALRESSRAHTPTGCSRVQSRDCGTTLIVNLPGSPAAVAEAGEAIAAALPHALALIASLPSDHRGTQYLRR